MDAGYYNLGRRLSHTNNANDPKNELFDPGFLFTPSDTFSLGHTVSPQYKTLQTDDRQTDDTLYHRLDR